jgi:hypothetical protein
VKAWRTGAVGLALTLAVGVFAPLGAVPCRADADVRASVCAPRRARTTRRPARNNSRRRRRGPAVTAAYIRTRTAWHRPAPRGVVSRWLANAVPPLVIKPTGGRAFELVPEDGVFGAEALAVARDAFRYRSDQQTTDIHPRLLEIAYRAVRHFQAPYVHLISGFRTTRATSRHNQGRAMDIVLPGVTDERLAAYLRQQGFVGVGVYPISGFVHLDVRERSYFWVDRSGPNQPSRVRTANAGLVNRFDAAARLRNEVAVADLEVGSEEDEEGGGGGD